MTSRETRFGHAAGLTAVLVAWLPLACAAPSKRGPEADAPKPAAREGPAAGRSGAAPPGQGAGLPAGEGSRQSGTAVASAKPADPNRPAEQAAAPDSRVSPPAPTAEAGQSGEVASSERQRGGAPGPPFVAAMPPAQAPAQPVAPSGTAPRAGTRLPSGGGAPARRHGPPGVSAFEAVPTVRMLPDSFEPVVGDRLTIRIEIDDARDVTSVPFHVTYNPAVLRFDEGVEGGFLATAGETAFFAAPMSSGAELVVGLSRLGGGPGAGGDGELCELRFTVVGPGDAGLGFLRAKVRDSENRIVRSAFNPASVVVR